MTENTRSTGEQGPSSDRQMLIGRLSGSGKSRPLWALMPGLAAAGCTYDLAPADAEVRDAGGRGARLDQLTVGALRADDEEVA